MKERAPRCSCRRRRRRCCCRRRRPTTNTTTTCSSRQRQQRTGSSCRRICCDDNAGSFFFFFFLLFFSLLLLLLLLLLAAPLLTTTTTLTTMAAATARTTTTTLATTSSSAAKTSAASFAVVAALLGRRRRNNICSGYGYNNNNNNGYGSRRCCSRRYYNDRRRRQPGGGGGGNNRFGKTGTTPQLSLSSLLVLSSRYYRYCRYPTTTTDVAATTRTAGAAFAWRTFEMVRAWPSSSSSISCCYYASSSDEDDDDGTTVGGNFGTNNRDYHLLPRLFVDGDGQRPALFRTALVGKLAEGEATRRRRRRQQQPPQIRSDDTNGARRRSVQLHPNAVVRLSDEQSRYLTTVMRIFGKGGANHEKKKGDGGNVQRPPPLVRLFDDGISGEWLARVVALDVDDDDDDDRSSDDPERRQQRSSSNQQQQRRRRRRRRQQQAVAHCIEQLRPPPPPRSSSSPWLFVAPPKRKERVRWLIEKATELSVQRLTLLRTDFSETASSSSSILSSPDKLRAYVVEAAEQSERLSLPRFVRFAKNSGADQNRDDGGGGDGDDDMNLPPLTADPPYSVPGELTTELSNFLDEIEAMVEKKDSTSRVKFLVCRERSNSCRSDVFSVWQALEQITARDGSNAEIAFVVGPEGGWSKNEEKRLDELARMGEGILYSVSLGPTVLRAETAAITACT